MAEINDWFTQHGRVVSAEPEKDPSDKYGTLTRYKFEDGAELVVRPGSTNPETGESTPQEIVERKLPDSKTRQPTISHVERNGEIYTITTPADGSGATITDSSGRKVSRLPPQEARRLVSTTYEGTGANRVKVSTYSDNTTEREAAPQEKKAVSVTYDADGTKVTTYDDASQTREAPSPSEQRAQATYNRPQIVSTPGNQRNLAQMDAEGNITSVPNPNFDQAAYDRQVAKEQAQAERDRLALQIEAGKLTEATAAAQYKRWFDENVTIPLQRAQEARARAAELRAAQEAEDRRQQFAASYEKDRQTTAINAGNAAANTFNNNLQYQVGPKFGEQFAQALNSFQPGAPPAQFTADAFTFKGPSIEAVARKATANALAGISPYAKAIATAGNRPLQTASYGPGTDLPDIAPSAAPPPATPPDYAGMINQYLQNNPYTPGAGGEEGQ